ncbi:MAG: bifunctional phosphoglucose/phosphomannose isomerase [Ignavibacteria bacterium]|nr:bifunctional phosphoglucose/phosphomannose isomerase [Ignavibacteria bacterium]
MTIAELTKKHDPDNLFTVLTDTWKQAEYAWGLQPDVTSLANRKFTNIIVSGLGGSAISGNLVLNFLKDELRLPMMVNRNYQLPKYAGADTLLIASSYSGNTEETISALKQGLAAGCGIVCLSTGGTVKEIAAQNGLPFVQLQPGFQPRYALGNSFFALVKVFQSLGLVESQESVAVEMIALWKAMGEELAAENNRAVQFAEKLLGTYPVILSVADVNETLGMRLKAQLNENSKLHAFTTLLPEHNHNEVVAWESYRGEQGNLSTIIIQDPEYHPQVQRRISIITELISKTGCPIFTLSSSYTTHKMRLAELVFLIDWISYYAGILRGQDPAEIDNIHYLKKKLSE